jgi:hypothetical protein
MKVKYKIIDNFLEKKDFLNIKNTMLSKTFTWYYSNCVSHTDDLDNFYFIHYFYNNYNVNSDKINLISCIIDKLKPRAIIRIKGNLYIKTKKILEHKKHVDFPFKHKSFIFYVNNNNGYTRLKDGTKIESVENRGLFFEADLEHNSTTCTDEKVRININFNYF